MSQILQTDSISDLETELNQAQSLLSQLLLQLAESEAVQPEFGGDVGDLADQLTNKVIKENALRSAIVQTQSKVSDLRAALDAAILKQEQRVAEGETVILLDELKLLAETFNQKQLELIETMKQINQTANKYSNHYAIAHGDYRSPLNVPQLDYRASLFSKIDTSVIYFFGLQDPEHGGKWLYLLGGK
ncbi:MAG: hypothetical protein KME35_17910 [Aphanocapsa sp. GSE-SYN-MK-11-07L]|jgi:chromosome segregation ATPase|nr:hypothetical protein [Aphanocapsa sp. GSE-SYN-MK-11-07L]